MAFFRGYLIPLLVVPAQFACAGRMESRTNLAAADAPVVSFNRPRPHATYTRGTSIAFAVTVTSKHELISVRADVTGALNFQFPPTNPADSTFMTVLRVTTGEARGDSLMVTVVATDARGNQGIGRRSVRLR